MNRVTRCFTLIMLFFSVQGAPAEDWTGFRGPRGLGTSDDARLPVRWSKTKNVRCNEYRCAQNSIYIRWRAGLAVPVPVPKKSRDRAGPGPGPGPERFLVPNFRI